jgi:hypothetical protein
MWTLRTRRRAVVGSQWSVVGAGVVLVAGAGCSGPASADPPALYTGAKAIRALAADARGNLWAATAGGVVCWRGDRDNAPRRWTTAEGLVSDDARALRILPDASGVEVALPTAVQRVTLAAPTPSAPFLSGRGAEIRGFGGADLIASSAGVLKGERGEAVGGAESVWKMATTPDGAAWAVTETELRRVSDGITIPLPADTAGMTVTAFTAVPDGSLLLATTLGLWRRAGEKWQAVPLPRDSRASHVSALSPSGAEMLAGLYGDGLYRLSFSGATPKWTRVPDAPQACHRVTAVLPLPNGGIAVGTLREGVWTRAGRSGPWRQRPLPLALSSADIYGLAAHDDHLWAATFDQGLLKIASGGEVIAEVGRAEGLSSPYPRQFVRFQGALFVRHTTGAVDRLDGALWRPAFAKKHLPRPQVFALAVSPDDRRLYLGGWAGWASTDGVTWEHHWNDPELAGEVITAIAAEANGAVWIGTQRRGLFRWEKGRYTHFHEAHGLGDDWITAIAVGKGRVLVGTYTGGLYEREADWFTRRFAADRFAIRSVVFLPEGGAVVATPVGVYREEASGDWRLIEGRRTAGLEAQTLLSMPGSLWVGTRTGLARVEMP